MVGNKYMSLCGVEVKSLRLEPGLLGVQISCSAVKLAGYGLGDQPKFLSLTYLAGLL